jgi:beta-glucosidase
MWAITYSSRMEKLFKRFRDLGISGEIGIAPNASWAVPYTSSVEDKAACLRVAA